MYSRDAAKNTAHMFVAHRIHVEHSDDIKMDTAADLDSVAERLEKKAEYRVLRSRRTASTSKFSKFVAPAPNCKSYVDDDEEVVKRLLYRSDARRARRTRRRQAHGG